MLQYLPLSRLRIGSRDTTVKEGVTSPSHGLHHQLHRPRDGVQGRPQAQNTRGVAGMGPADEFIAVGLTIGVRVDEETEVMGLDQAEHAETAYNL